MDAVTIDHQHFGIACHVSHTTTTIYGTKNDDIGFSMSAEMVD